MSVVRISIPLHLSAYCCEGSEFFVDEKFLNQVPDELVGKISEQDWSRAMDRLHYVCKTDTPAICTNMASFLVCGFFACIYIDYKTKRVYTRLVKSVEELNREIFETRGLFMSINRDGNSLDIALDEQEARYMRIRGTLV